MGYHCSPLTENNNMCKDKEQISDWLEQHPLVRIILKMVLFALLVTLVTGLVLLMFNLANTPGGEVKDDKLVISFLGVLATFIVIGNFTQTSRIEDRLKDDIKRLNDRIQVCETENNKFATIETEISGHTTEIGKQASEIAAIKTSMSETSKSLDKKDLAKVLKLFIGQEGDVRKYMHLYAKFLNPDSRFAVEYKDGTKDQITISYSADQKVLNFIDKSQCLVDPEDIAYISGVSFYEGEILYAYQLLNELDTQENDTQESETQKVDNSEMSGENHKRQ